MKCPKCNKKNFSKEGYFSMTIDVEDGEESIVEWESSTPYNMPCTCTCFECGHVWREQD
jgi:hypothetical protein